MKTYVVIKAGDLWARPQTIKARNFRCALAWCFKHDYELIEEVL